jgi:subtilisin family serine protease
MKLKFLFVACIAPALLLAQETSTDNFKKENLNWFDKDYDADKILGASVNKTYELLLKDLAVKDTIIVAVIDGGVDIYHDELKGKIWVNKKEIPGNNMDDDNNGYVDDVNGWNFLGNKSGENIKFENYEFTRIVKEKNPKDPDYAMARELFDKEMKSQQDESDQINKLETLIDKCLSIIHDKAGMDVKTLDDIKKVPAIDAQVSSAKSLLTSLYSQGLTKKDLDDDLARIDEYFKYYLNVNFNPRSMVGDDPSTVREKNYGNNDVKGPWPDHGTGVAGIIASERSNNKGILGVAVPVKIMSVRVVPNGDERDKDIALGIHYAVDNGARVINMSFGKRFSPNKELVDEAVRYAEKHHVLLVHAAGNDAEDLDLNENYPSRQFKDGGMPTNWISVGASSMYRSKELPGHFSNYGKKQVDLFAPGVDMISLDTNNTYSMHDGTSIAAPVVSGVAALLLAYFPELTPAELISILKEGAAKVAKPKKVYKPGEREVKKRPKIKFSELSSSGGVVNCYQSFLIAMSRYKK